ncbi:MAG: carboxypeptidase regulatory-like domain-containing protein, partial [Desulfuromonadales bacterium]
MRNNAATIVAVLVLAFSCVSFAGEYTIFGPKRFNRGNGQPATETAPFASPVTGGGFKLKIHNNDAQVAGRVSSGTVALNGVTVANPSDFNQKVASIERVVPLGSANNLSIQLNSQPGSYLTVSVTGEDNDPPDLAITSPENGSILTTDSVDVVGNVVDDTPVSVNVNGKTAVVAGQSFSVAAVPLTLGENRLSVSATDLGGNISSYSITVSYQLPRPKVEPQPEGSFGSQYQDLVPADATKTVYDPKRFALITGEVTDLNNEPIAGVSVSVGANSCVECHGLEYGSVKTDAEGRFTLPVEGGSTMTVVYKKAGLITSHRQVYVPWNGYAVADTAVLIPQDSAATTVTFNGNPQTVATHLSTPISDAFGTRAAT